MLRKPAIGTLSILFGAHAFWLHPWFVAWGWWLTYTWPGIKMVWGRDAQVEGVGSVAWRTIPLRQRLRSTLYFLWHFLDPRLWLAFAVHDIGYWGKPNMDGPEGERHPYVGARIMAWFDGSLPFMYDRNFQDGICWVLDKLWGVRAPGGVKWYDFVLYHSRYLAKGAGEHYSLLCVADKMTIAVTPSWLYVPMVRLTGEIKEYRGFAGERHPDMPVDDRSDWTWHASIRDYCRRWVTEHQGGDKEDTWTTKRSH